MVTEIIRDTINVLDASKVAELYSDMIDKQQGQFNIFLVAIGIVFAAVIGSTWWWNYSGSKAKIQQDIDEGLKRYQRLLNAHKSSTETMINEEVGKKVKEQMDVLFAEMNKELESFKSSITHENKEMNADLNRVFALHCDTAKLYFPSACWWLSAFEGFADLNEGEFEQVSINEFVENLEKCLKNQTLSDDSLARLPGLETRVEKIPDVFTEQRTKAKKLLKQIADKAKKAKEEKNR